VSQIPLNSDHTGSQFNNGELWATGKDVVVIGGGDTGSDCVGTSNRHRANSVRQIELLAKPPLNRHESTPWPLWPMMLRTSSSHDEGCDRKWAILTKEFTGNEAGEVPGIKTVEIEWKMENGRPSFVEIPGTEKIQPATLVLLAMGFLHPQHEGMLKDLGIELDERGNVKTENYQTSVAKVFSAGDMRRGQSLVVWAIAEGRECARAVDLYLMGSTRLEARDRSLLHVEAE
jgi:glutamate synthase (NADPH/NADH) small chain